MKRPLNRTQRGFTLVELLVVITIIILISAATLPVIVPAFNHRKVSEAARILQATLAGARDAAIRANAPRGIRLLPDPTFPGPNPLASNRMISIEPAPDYSEGRVTIFGHNLPSVANNGRISITESVFTAPIGDPNSFPENPTNWYWNIRQGDKIRFEDSGRYYTIAGPMRKGPVGGVGPTKTAGNVNPERYVNFDLLAALGNTTVFGGDAGGAIASPATTPDPFTKGYTGGQILYLVNGQDDDGDGWVDEGFDGIDNDGDGIIDPGYNGIDDNGNGVIDEPAELLFTLNAGGLNEYEAEQFIGSQFGTQFVSKGYTIIRRPVVSEKSTEIALPDGVVIDLTTWNAPGAGTGSGNGFVSRPSNPERSRLPVDPYTLSVDIMLTPSGQVLLPGGGTGGVNSGGFNPQASAPFYHFWLTEREDVFAPLFGTVNASIQIPNSNTRYQVVGVPTANPSYNSNPPLRYLLPMPNDGTNGYSPPTAAGVANTAYLNGDRRLVTLFTRTGQITTNVIESFDVNNTELPFIAPQFGTREVK
jgi:prepilin-type N-terminal cleavage/methylation domain-containing protein